MVDFITVLIAVILIVAGHRAFCEYCISAMTLLSSTTTDDHFEFKLDGLHNLVRISLYETPGAFTMDYKVDDTTDWKEYKDENGFPGLFRSTVKSAQSSSILRDAFLSTSIRFIPIQLVHSDVDLHVDLVGCRVDLPMHFYNGSNFSSSEWSSAGLYHNELLLNLRTLTSSGLVLLSQGDEGDLLVVEIVTGRVVIRYNFGGGSGRPSTIQGGSVIDDGHWHQIRWSHRYGRVRLFLDGVMVDSRTPDGLYRRLDLHQQILLGGSPFRPLYSSSLLPIPANFSGCIRMASLNQIDLLDGVQAEPRRNSNDNCQNYHPPDVLTMLDESSSLAMTIESHDTIDVQFRTFTNNTVLLKMFDSNDTNLFQIGLDNGYLTLSTNHLNFPSSLKTKSEQVLICDGAWHTLHANSTQTSLMIYLDNSLTVWIQSSTLRPILDRIVSVKLGGFVGCFRSLKINFGSIQMADMQITSPVVFNHCQLLDRCSPNPCQNQGDCIQIGLVSQQCHCADGYFGPTCHHSRLPRSCEDYFIMNGSFSRNILIDLDGGNGPLQSFLVYCEKDTSFIDGNAITTILSHSSGSVTVVGVPDAGGLVHRLDYNTGMVELDTFVKTFRQCSQSMHYQCQGGAKLMEYGKKSDQPSSWYVGRHGQTGVHWGDTRSRSRSCSCVLTQSCISPLHRCNCDSGRDAVDEGNNTDSQMLPIMELYLGGTDSEGKMATVSIGPLRCSGPVAFTPMTFLDRDAFLTGEFDPTSSFDVYLHFRTNHESGVLISAESDRKSDRIKVYFKDAFIYGQTISSGQLTELYITANISNDHWHAVSFISDRNGLFLALDDRFETGNGSFIPPLVTRWHLGSSNGMQGMKAGFAGLMRSVFVNNAMVEMSRITREMHCRVVEGESGKCSETPCSNQGICLEKYDSFQCDCSHTPFEGVRCQQDLGVTISPGAHLQYMLHPAQNASNFRVGFRTSSTSSSILSASGMFTDSSLNLTVDHDGSLALSISDGVQVYVSIDDDRRFDDSQFYDVRIAAFENTLTFTINNYLPLVLLADSWAFLNNLNMWQLVDSTFSGCLSRVQIGTAFPLRNWLHSDRLFIHNGQITSNQCAFVAHAQTSSPKEVPSLLEPIVGQSEISISEIVPSPSPFSISFYGPAMTAVVGSLLLSSLLLCYYVRRLPDGVYKTNEHLLRCSTPAGRGESVVLNSNQKEYFC